jgi:hypothetical protein
MVMGREAVCECTFEGTTSKVKALLESAEVILRGEIRMRIPFNVLQNVRVESQNLCFSIDNHPMQLQLGAKAAESWAKKIKTLPPSLAHKLGVTDKTVVRTIGPINKAILSALSSAGAQIRNEKPDLIISCLDTPETLIATLQAAKTQLACSIPIWVVYRKGPGHPLNEAAIRTCLRANGLMDTKVASVSTELTALRFNRPKST